jgi:pimeloyl-ACP methyl ester carboxylesterase
MTAETRYAKSGDVHIAYRVVGDGPIDLVFVPGWITHLELAWEDPLEAAFLRRLASFLRLILFDKRGTGLSDRVPVNELPILEERMDDVRAVMDAAGSERAALLGVSEGGPLSSLFAATYPERTAALVLYGTFAQIGSGLMTQEELDARLDALERDWPDSVDPSVRNGVRHRFLSSGLLGRVCDFCRRWGLAADPDVSLLDYETVLIETQERHADEVFAAAVGEFRFRAPRDRGSVAVDDRWAELAAGRVFFGEDAREVAGLGLAERMLLPVHALGVERGDRVGVVLGPTSLPHLGPALRGPSGIHASSLEVNATKA